MLYHIKNVITFYIVYGMSKSLITQLQLTSGNSWCILDNIRVLKASDFKAPATCSHTWNKHLFSNTKCVCRSSSSFYEQLGAFLNRGPSTDAFVSLNCKWNLPVLAVFKKITVEPIFKNAPLKLHILAVHVDCSNRIDLKRVQWLVCIWNALSSYTS